MDYLLSDNDIERKVVDLVERTRQEHGFTAHTPGRDACERLGLDLICRRDIGGRDGFYDPASRKVVLNQDRTKWHPRHEFTIYHEIMHHLFETDGELIEYLHEMLINEDDDVVDRAMERACNLGAAEFLAPRTKVQEVMSKRGLNPELIQHVADTLGTGLVASAIRVGHCATIDCYVVLAEEGPSRFLPHDRAVLRVEYASWPDVTKFPLARFSPIQTDHLFHQVWHCENNTGGHTYVPFPSTLTRSNRRMPCWGDALIAGSRLLGVLKLENENTVPENQLRLAI